MNMDTSAKTLNLQSDLKAAELADIIYQDFQYKDKRWSDSATSEFVTTFCEGLLFETNDRLSLYKTVRVGLSEFEVHYTGDNDESQSDDNSNASTKDYFSKVPIPLFSRIRNVKIGADGTAFCQCCRFECEGLFCVHHVSVATTIFDAAGKKFPGFNHHDVAVRWWSAYMHLAYKDTTSSVIKQKFHRLATNDILGPSIQCLIPDKDVLPFNDRSPILPALERLKNYNKQDIDLDLYEGMFWSKVYEPESMSQDSEQELNKLFEDISIKLRYVISPEMEELFDSSINDASLPSAAFSNARMTLKGKIDASFAMTDCLGPIALKKFSEVLSDYQSWCTIESAKSASDPLKKKSGYIPMTDHKYSGPKRVYNTFHM